MKKLSKLNQRRLNNFKNNKRGYYSFWIFSILFIISLFADLIANEKPLLIKHNESFYYPIFSYYLASKSIRGSIMEYIKSLIIPIINPSNEKKYKVANITG